MLALHKLLLLHFLASLGRIADGGEIINGRVAPPHSMPYMVSVHRALGHWCGGFLVSEDFVLTAAHCDEERLLEVVIGTNNYYDKSNGIWPIKEKYKHPGYIQGELGYRNDIMLLKLFKKVKLDKKVQLIPWASSETKAQQRCQVAGWGRTESGLGSEVLKVADVSIIDLETCRNLWRGLPEKVICAGGYATNQGFCQGDSGGPLVCDGKAVGIVSFNKYENCTYPNVPNVYTDVFKFRRWIEETIENNR